MKPEPPVTSTRGRAPFALEMPAGFLSESTIRWRQRLFLAPAQVSPCEVQSLSEDPAGRDRPEASARIGDRGRSVSFRRLRAGLAWDFVHLGRCRRHHRRSKNERSAVSAYIITRIQVGDYDSWRPMFDQDRPRAREGAISQRVFRTADDPNHV